MEDFEDDHNSETLDEKEDEENEGILDAVKQFQSKQKNHTCLMPENMAAQVFVNHKSVPINLPTEKPNEFFKFAPSEGKIPSNRMREEHDDVKAFPRHHPSGKYGLNHPREIKLTPCVYFNQRTMNKDERFSTDSFYLFNAAAYVEQHGLERQINISGVHGQKDTIQNGEVKVHLNDMFDVFKNIKGTPKYWQIVRNELIAKIKQLGPFHMFFTFSCGEMRWSEVFLSLLLRKGYKVEIPDNWDGEDSTLMVEGKELWDYINEDISQTKHELFQDYTFLITRMFDARVKSFIKNILLGRGSGKVSISHYSYRYVHLLVQN